MTFNVKKITGFIFPLLAIIAISLALFNYLVLRDLQISLAEKIEKIENINKPPQVLEETIVQSAEELQEKHDQENKDLKERSLEFSPNKSKIAYFQNKFTDDLKNLGDSDYVSVVIEENGQQKTVFQENYHVSNLEWLNDREIVVYRSCGTECVIAYIVDTITKHQQQLALGVGYTWSPNKQYVAAYHFSYEYGISIANRGNKYGQTIFQLRRKHPPNGSGLTDETQVAWSPTSTKLAVVIKKDSEEKLELIVLDIQKDFKNIYQQDLTNIDVSGIVWKGENIIVITDDYGSKKISL